uniref:Uncharacterized protein n=1 Tax=Arundo donax TaxID=35708 RepID=A0A0A9HAM3_ARUDO
MLGHTFTRFERYLLQMSVFSR